MLRATGTSAPTPSGKNTKDKCIQTRGEKKITHQQKFTQMEDGDLQHKSYQNRFSQYSPRGKSSRSKDRRTDLTPPKKHSQKSTQTNEEAIIHYDPSQWREQLQQNSAKTNITYLDGVVRNLWPAQTTQLSKA